MKSNLLDHIPERKERREKRREKKEEEENEVKKEARTERKRERESPSSHASVCSFKTPSCEATRRPHVQIHAGVLPLHMEACWT